MKEPQVNNNEFQAAERELRKIGSNLWFGGLSDEWQDFLRSNTVECFDTYEVSMNEAAIEIIKIYQQMVSSNPDILKLDPRG